MQRKVPGNNIEIKDQPLWIPSEFRKQVIGNQPTVNPPANNTSMRQFLVSLAKSAVSPKKRPADKDNEEDQNEEE